MLALRKDESKWHYAPATLSGCDPRVFSCNVLRVFQNLTGVSHKLDRDRVNAKRRKRKRFFFFLLNGDRRNAWLCAVVSHGDPSMSLL